MEDHYHDVAGRLTNKQETELARYLKTTLHQTAREVAAFIWKTCGIGYSIEGTTHLLDRLGFVYKKTTIVPGRINLAKDAL